MNDDDNESFDTSSSTSSDSDGSYLFYNDNESDELDWDSDYTPHENYSVCIENYCEKTILN